MKTVLTIAGSDSSGGAGIQTDLKTFSALKVYGTSVITAITAQNTTGVLAIEEVSSKMVGKQIDAIFEDIEVDAVKIGMLPNPEIINVIIEKIEKYSPRNIVLDPVMISTSGCDLIGEEAKECLVNKLGSMVKLITPNLSETRDILKILNKNEDRKDFMRKEDIDNAKVLKKTGEGFNDKKFVLSIEPYGSIDSIDDMKKAGIELVKKLYTNVLIKGGHLEDKPCDVLVEKDLSITVFENKRINTKNTHGTGCTLSSALASYLARGFNLKESMERSKKFITDAIENSIDIGRGSGPTNPMGRIYNNLEVSYE